MSTGTMFSQHVLSNDVNKIDPCVYIFNMHVVNVNTIHVFTISTCVAKRHVINDVNTIHVFTCDTLSMMSTQFMCLQPT